MHIGRAVIRLSLALLTLKVLHFIWSTGNVNTYQQEAFHYISNLRWLEVLFEAYVCMHEVNQTRTPVKIGEIAACF